MIDKDVARGDIDTAINFLEDIMDIVEEPYFNTRDYWVALERLRSLKADLESEGVL